MLPVFRQRLLIAAACVIGSIIWLWAGFVLAANDALPGYTIVNAGTGPLLALIVVVLTAIPAVLLGLYVGAVGNPLSGVFTVAAALMILAASGGSIDGFLWRNALPGAFILLAFEMVVWLVGAVVVLILLQQTRSAIRNRLPHLAVDDFYGSDIRFFSWSTNTVIATLVCVVVGGFFTTTLVRSSDTGQVVGSVLLAFLVGGLVAQTVLKQSNPIGILLAPALVGIGAYLYVGLGMAGSDTLSAWYKGDLPGAAQVLPIFYISAGVAGSALGVGFAQGIEHARHLEAIANSSKA